MKASSKYGSVYPQAASSKTSRAVKRHKTVSSDTPVAAANATALKLPHERDESVDQGGGSVPSESVKQAYRDVKRGLPDTDRGVEMNQTYQKQKT